MGADGKPRPLHVKEGLAAMDLSLLPPTPSDAVTCPYFDFEKVRGGAASRLSPSDRWRVVYLPADADTVLLPPGEVLDLPSDAFVTTVK